MDRTGNHAVGFKIVHFAEVAIVSPLFYWQWGSVLTKIVQTCTDLHTWRRAEGV